MQLARVDGLASSTVAPSGGVKSKRAASTGSYETLSKPTCSTGSRAALGEHLQAQRHEGLAVDGDLHRAEGRVGGRRREAQQVDVAAGDRRPGRSTVDGRRAAPAAASRRGHRRRGVMRATATAKASRRRAWRARHDEVARRVGGEVVDPDARGRRRWRTTIRSPPPPCDSTRTPSLLIQMRPEPPASSGFWAGMAPKLSWPMSATSPNSPLLPGDLAAQRPRLPVVRGPSWPAARAAVSAGSGLDDPAPATATMPR